MGEKQEYDKAIADYGKAIRLDPNDASTYRRRAYAWLLMDDHDLAIADWNQVIRLDPGSPTAYRTGARSGRRRTIRTRRSPTTTRRSDSIPSTPGVCQPG